MSEGTLTESITVVEGAISFDRRFAGRADGIAVNLMISKEWDEKFALTGRFIVRWAVRDRAGWGGTQAQPFTKEFAARAFADQKWSQIKQWALRQDPVVYPAL